MSRVALAVVEALSSGMDLSVGQTAIVHGVGNGVTIPAQRGVVLCLFNPTVGTVTVTIKTNKTVDGIALGDKIFTMATLKEYLFKVLPTEPYAQLDGQIYIETSATGMFATAFQVEV